MEDHESHGNEHDIGGGSPESPCLKSSTSNINKEQDRFLPIANVGRIMKKVIPASGKISKDAKETVQECVSEFISFVTGEASDKCQREKRKTINGDDIIWAITTLGFEDYVYPLKTYLQKYRDIEGEKLYNIPKQQRSDQQQRLQQHKQQHKLEQNITYDINDTHSLYGLDKNDNRSVYSSISLMSQQPFVAAELPFLMPFSPSSVQKQLQPQDQIDSLGHW